MEHAVGVVGLGHAFGQAADGKEAAEEAIDGQVRGHRCYRALSCAPGSARHAAAHAMCRALAAEGGPARRA